MRTDSEIQQMFKDMGLETDEKRSRFDFSYSYTKESSSDTVAQVRLDSETEESKEQKDA